MSRPMEIRPIEARLESVLEHAAELIRLCKRCNTRIYFVRGRNGAVIPFTADGLSHFTNCPRLKAAAIQAAMFDTAPLPE